MYLILPLVITIALVIVAFIGANKALDDLDKTTLQISINVDPSSTRCKYNYDWCTKYTEHVDDTGTWGSCDIFGTLENICDRHINCLSAQKQAEESKRRRGRYAMLKPKLSKA